MSSSSIYVLGKMTRKIVMLLLSQALEKPGTEMLLFYRLSEPKWAKTPEKSLGFSGKTVLAENFFKIVETMPQRRFFNLPKPHANA